MVNKKPPLKGKYIKGGGCIDEEKKNKRSVNDMFENNKKTVLEVEEIAKTVVKNWPLLVIIMIAAGLFYYLPNIYSPETALLQADLKVGLDDNTKLSWLERAKSSSRDATKDNPFVVSDGKLLLLYFGDSVRNSMNTWDFDLDGDDGVFSLPLIGGAEPWLWAVAEYDYYYNRAGTIKNADGTITVPLVLRIKDGDGKEFSEDRVYIKILPS